MTNFGAPEIAIVLLLGVVPLIVWAAGNVRQIAEVPDDFREELKKRMQERAQQIEPKDANDNG